MSNVQYGQGSKKPPSTSSGPGGKLINGTAPTSGGNPPSAPKSTSAQYPTDKAAGC